MKNEKDVVSNETKVLKLPEVLQQTLLELAYQKSSIDKQMGTIAETFFVTKGLNPKEYSIDLEKNIVTKIQSPLQNVPQEESEEK